IDTVAPIIDVSSPQDGLLTNQTAVQISGRVSEVSSLSINNIPKTVQADRTFSHGPFALAEGENVFRLKATDPAGNIGERSLRVTRDTVPPPAPRADQIQAQQQSDGRVSVSGAAGSVEGGSAVTLVNTRTGERVTAEANPDGSFSASIAGENGDEIRIFATDRAGNTGQAASIVVKGDPFTGPINLTVVAPANGVTVSGDRVLVVADLKAPQNTGVIVNGIPASGVPVSTGLRFYTTVPLTVGQNALAVTATAQDGRTVTRTVNIGSTGPSAFSVTAEPVTGIAPQTINFQTTDQLGVGIREVRYDFDNNGTQDLVTTNPFEPVSTTFTGVGLRTISVNIIDASGTIRNQTANIVLLDPTQLDGVIKAIWD
ncbi:MAG: Ig-like domain-containing protein, partial [Nevskiales bacterium]